MKEIIVNLSKIIDGLEMVSNDIDCYYNPERDEIITSNIGEKENLTVDEIDEVLCDSIILPTSYEINEYQMMEDFIDTVDNNEIKEELYRVIQGRGAFRRFKDYCIDNDLIDDWYNFRDKRYMKIAIDWCNDNDIKYKE